MSRNSQQQYLVWCGAGDKEAWSELVVERGEIEKGKETLNEDMDKVRRKKPVF